jgi:hypothetical protein
MTTFLTVSSYVLFPMTTIQIIIMLTAEASYKESLDRIVDNAKGFERRYHYGQFVFVWILSLAWIISRWVF